MNKYKSIFKVTILLVFSLTLNSCNWYQCEAEGKILIRNNQYLFPLQNDLSKLQLSFDEILELIKSDAIIDAVAEELSSNQQYREYLSHKQFDKNFEVIKIEGVDVFNLSYRHPDNEFANKVVNTWIDTVVEKTIRKHKKVTENLDNLYRNGNSRETINEVVSRFKKQHKYNDYLAAHNFAQNLRLNRNYKPDLVSVYYHHQDVDFANNILNTWAEIMYDNYGYLSDVSKFIVNKNVANNGLISWNIYINYQDIGIPPDILEYANGTCSQPNFFNF